MKQFKNILYLSEGPASQQSAMARAVSLAQNNQADLTVIDVVPIAPAFSGSSLDGSGPVDLQAAMVGARREELAALVAPYESRIGIAVDVLVGKRFLQVIRAILRNDHDLLIKPAENPTFVSRLFGSDDMHLLRKCPCPVWLTGPEEKTNYSCILAAVDFNLDSPESPDADLNRQISELASSLAVSDFAQLHFVHVWDAPAEIMVRSWSHQPDEAGKAYVDGEHKRHGIAFEQLRAQLETTIGKAAVDHLAPRFHLQRGAPDRVIPELAATLRADLVVMGTVARTGISGLLIGNTAETILEQLQCSVLAVKPGGFVSPVKLAD